MKESDLFAAAGAAGWGCCAFSDLPMSTEARAKAAALCPNPAGVYVAAFPYLGEDFSGNLSRYARGADYHAVLLRRLEPVCRGLEALYPGYTFHPGTDDSPLPEREAALLSGLGLLGDHGLVILPPYGSWIFLGTILTDLLLPTPETPGGECLHCGACVRACPGGALEGLRRGEGFDQSRCLSALTQKKGELTEEEAALLRSHPLIWGCDCCQQVCPYNRAAPLSSLPEFREHLISSLKQEDLDGLSNKGFRARFSGRAFTWRGPGPLRRNLALEDKEADFGKD